MQDVSAPQPPHHKVSDSVSALILPCLQGPASNSHDLQAAGLLLAGFAAMQLAAAPIIGEMPASKLLSSSVPMPPSCSGQRVCAAAPAQAFDGPGAASGSVAKGGGFPALPNPFASNGGTKQQTGNTGNDVKALCCAKQLLLLLSRLCSSGPWCKSIVWRPWSLH